MVRRFHWPVLQACTKACCWAVSDSQAESASAAARAVGASQRRVMVRMNTPFAAQDAMELRQQIITEHVDGLIRELVLDKANGLQGKTVIHPSHVRVVHALSVVSHEEYVDATDILAPDLRGGGVSASSYHNKMNEVKPHRAWAQRTLRRARAFGVAAEGIRLVDLLGAGSS